MPRKKKSRPATEVVREDFKSVRLYYEMVLTYALPGMANQTSPTKRKAAAARRELDELKEKYANEITCELNRRLTDEFDEVDFRRHEMAYPNVARLWFTVSKKHRFSAHEIYSPRTGYSGFAIKTAPLEKAKSTTAKNIIARIGSSYCISGLAFEDVVSRDFVFQLFFEGQLTIKCEITKEQILENEGISGALESVFTEINSALPDNFGGVDTPHRKSKNNRYKIEFAITEDVCINEDEIVGEMAAIEPGMHIDDVNSVGLDFPGDVVDGLIRGLEVEADYIDLPEGVSVQKAEFFFVDYDEDVFDYSDELVSNKARSANKLKRA